MCLAVTVLAAYSLCFIYSCGYISAEYPVRGGAFQQACWFLVGGCGAVLMAHWPSQRFSWKLMAWIGYAVSLVLLVLVLFVGKRIGGASRWLSFGGFLLQPAEISKFFTLCVFALTLTAPLSRWRKAAACLALTLTPTLLIAYEPSFGNAAILLLPAFLAALSYSLPPKACIAAFILFFGLAVGGVFGLCWLRAHPHIQNQWLDKWTVSADGQEGATAKSPLPFLHPYHVQRLRSLLSPNGGWNEQQALMTLADGGLHGRGYLRGNLKSAGFLPRTVAPTDFLFTVIGEEAGFLWGAMPVLLLYGVIALIGFHWAAHAETETGSVLCLVFTWLLFGHVVVNIGMVTRLLPVIGLPLPLLSYGGSFTCCTMLALGVMAGVCRQQGNAPESAPNGIPPLLQFSWGSLLKTTLSCGESRGQH